MAKIFKRRQRRPMAVHKGSMRRTPNFYPQFYGDGGELAVRVIDGLEGVAGAGMQAAKSFAEGGWKYGLDDKTFKVRTHWTKNPETGEYKTAEVGAGDVASSAMAALQGAGELTKGALDLAETADTTAVQDQIDEAFDTDFDEASDNQSLLASFGNTGNLRTDWSGKDLRGMTGGEKALGLIGNAASGAMAGAAAGSIAPPMGTAIGAAAGFVAGLGSGIGGMLAGDAKARRQAEHLNAQAEAANKYALNAFDSANQSMSDKNWRSNLVNLSAYGGQLDGTQENVAMPYIQHKNNDYAHGGGIHINPANRGKFSDAASRAGMGTQEYARHVLANSGDYDAMTVRRANFARNAAKWKHGYGGCIYDGEEDTPPFPYIAPKEMPAESTFVPQGAFVDGPFVTGPESQANEALLLGEDPGQYLRQMGREWNLQQSMVPGLEEPSVTYEYPNDIQRRLASYRHAANWDMDYIPNLELKVLKGAATTYANNYKGLATAASFLPYGAGWIIGPLIYVGGSLAESALNDDDAETTARKVVPKVAGTVVDGIGRAFLKNDYGLGTLTENGVGYLWDYFSPPDIPE